MFSPILAKITFRGGNKLSTPEQIVLYDIDHHERTCLVQRADNKLELMKIDDIVIESSLRVQVPSSLIRPT